MIRDIQISAYNRGGGDQQMTEPPERVLNVSVIGDAAFLDIKPVGEDDTVGATEASIQVPAKSLLRALQAGVEDSADKVSELSVGCHTPDMRRETGTFSIALVVAGGLAVGLAGDHAVGTQDRRGLLVGAPLVGLHDAGRL